MDVTVMANAGLGPYGEAAERWLMEKKERE